MGTVRENSKLSSISVYETEKKKYAVKLDANENFMSFPESLKEELIDRIMNIEFNRYPDNESEEACKLYARYCGVEPFNVIAGNGSDELIQIIINGFLGKDEKILTFKPDFSMYKFYSSLVEGKVIEISLDENMQIDADQIIERANQEQAKIVIFSNPNNPTGVIIPREDILKILKNCNSLVVVDEAYYEFYGESVVDCINEYENLVVLRTCSKAVGLAAIRLGFLIANEQLIKSINKARPPFNVNALSQAVGEIVLSNPDIITERVKEIIRERDYLASELIRVEEILGRDRFRVFPSRANFVFVKTSNAEEIYKRLKEDSIIVRSFNNATLRITIGSGQENKAFIEALNKILEV